ncbi:DPH3-like [Porphyridium purpureum]|uniref:Diphthamide biosynthesis protein 3 n=1 Tax=Porphyridium purpureum TaxID=35688 RepID=A0A5J4YJD4_PORPP|nr:DPH3-like [Porphyridium purpureum]KAA8492368.1 DPH3-like [Porphyridium purpureum]|eukprot:POR8448..scf251_18
MQRWIRTDCTSSLYISEQGISRRKSRLLCSGCRRDACCAARQVNAGEGRGAAGGSSRMATVYDEVEIEDMEWDDALNAFTYPCPCGDVFRITKDELRAGEEIGTCPSCSLTIRVIYDQDEFEQVSPDKSVRAQVSASA